MINYVFIFLVCVALLMSILVWVYSLFRSQSDKKKYFLLMQSMVILYLFGHILELTSANAEEAFGAVRVLYTGVYLASIFAFFFIADYCNVRIHLVFAKFPIMILTLAAILTMWTTRYHGLVYRNYFLDTAFVHNLNYVPGPLFSVIHTYPIVWMVLALLIILRQIQEWKNKYRKQLLILFICVVIPFMTELVYYATVMIGINKHHLYLTPMSMALMSFFLYLGVIRFNIFEIISVATVTAMEHIKEGFILVDESNYYLSSNPAAMKIFPGIAQLIKGESIFSAAGWPEELKNMESGNSIDFTLIDKDAKFFSASISPVIAENKILIAKIIILRETTDSVNLMKELENAAYMDALTGLYNRKHFTELASADIERALRAGQTLYTAMLDLDFFKQVNDTHGHAAGDLVLKTTAGIIRQTIRAYDLLCRYGGEEFVLLITDLELTEAKKLMDRIRENMEHNITFYENTEIKITCSIGLAQFTKGDTLEMSIKKADEALYAAKNSGRNQVQVYTGKFQFAG